MTPLCTCSAPGCHRPHEEDAVVEPKCPHCNTTLPESLECPKCSGEAELAETVRAEAEVGDDEYTPSPEDLDDYALYLDSLPRDEDEEPTEVVEREELSPTAKLLIDSILLETAKKIVKQVPAAAGYLGVA